MTRWMSTSGSAGEDDLCRSIFEWGSTPGVGPVDHRRVGHAEDRQPHAYRPATLGNHRPTVVEEPH